MANLTTAIRALRGTKTQQEFAQSVGVSRVQISNWERGTHTPSGDNLLALYRLGLRTPELGAAQ